MRITNGRLDGVAYKPAKFFGGPLRDVRGIVMHGTAGALEKFSTVRWLQKPWDSTAKVWRKASYHFVIERDGTITQMVPTNRQAWHAGRSNWDGLIGLNSSYIGIGLVCPGKLDKHGRSSSGYVVEGFELVQKVTKAHGDGWWLPYSDEQIAAVDVLSRALTEAYTNCNDMIGHHDCSPGRKIDPNPLFPWEHCRSEMCKVPQEEAVSDLDDDLATATETPDTPDKTMANSKVGATAIVQGVGGATVTTVAVLEKAADTAEKADQSVDKLWSLAFDPVLLIGAGAVIFAVFFWWDRYRKNKDFGI